mmetsp:Transcript_31619/g.30923  ORF Transcript_31619/g.30923 Transcript_31619/m.30923 type:complete len:124 (+) Transcript_31619:1191-1562(+)
MLLLVRLDEEEFGVHDFFLASIPLEDLTQSFLLFVKLHLIYLHLLHGLRLKHPTMLETLSELAVDSFPKREKGWVTVVTGLEWPAFDLLLAKAPTHVDRGKMKGLDLPMTRTGHQHLRALLPQ